MQFDDLADALLLLMQPYSDPAMINVGSRQEISIAELAHLIGKVAGYDGALAFDPSKPDGTSRKRLGVSRLHSLGWRQQVPLEQGSREAYEAYAALPT
jgi:GDP-L-fucose synthase